MRLREKFGFKVNDPMWAFFQELGVIDADGRPTEHFGDPVGCSCNTVVARATRAAMQQILDEGRATTRSRSRARGVFIAEGHGNKPWDLRPDIDSSVRELYDDAKVASGPN